MKKHPFRLLLAFGLIAATWFASGCAHVVDVLNATAGQLEQERQAREYYDYYAPRPSSDTSARGIK